MSKLSVINKCLDEYTQIDIDAVLELLLAASSSKTALTLRYIINAMSAVLALSLLVFIACLFLRIAKENIDSVPKADEKEKPIQRQNSYSTQGAVVMMHVPG